MAFIDPTGECPIGACPDNHAGVVWTNGLRFSDEKHDDTWEVFQGEATVLNDGTGTLLTVTGEYIDGAYSGGWYSADEEVINIDADGSTGVSEATPTRQFLVGFKQGTDDIRSGSYRGAYNFGANTINFSTYVLSGGPTPLALNNFVDIPQVERYGCRSGAECRYMFGTEVGLTLGAPGGVLKFRSLRSPGIIVTGLNATPLRGFNLIKSDPLNKLVGRSADEVESMLGTGWTRGTYGRTSEAGWKFTNGDKSVFYSGSGGRHKSHYWGYSSGSTGKVKYVPSEYKPVPSDKATIVKID